MSSRQRLPAETRRDQILDTALRLFIAHGFGQVDPRAIARELRISRPAFYTYFSSMENLLDVLLDRLTAQYFAEIDRRFAEVDAPDARLTFEILLTQRDLLLLLQSGGGPQFQAARARMTARMDERTRNVNQQGVAPEMVLLTRMTLFSLATALLQHPEGEAQQVGGQVQQLLEVGFRAQRVQA